MHHDDPLDGWLIVADIRSAPELAEWHQTQIRMVARQFPKGFVPASSSGGSLENLDDVQALYRHVYAMGGTGTTYVQEHLLNLIAAAAEPGTVPFWLEVLALSRPRETFAKRRRTLALAALAYVAIRRDDAAAYAALRDATRHAVAEVRAEAIQYLGRAFLEAERPFPPDVVDELSRIAVRDKAFGPRFQARSALRRADLPVPMDHPGGVYLFKVTFLSAKRISRSLALRSEHTLDDLHFAIQRAIRWDGDHLYSFFMNGTLYDEQYQFACPAEEDAPAFTTEVVIGELGLVPKHRFLYYFDYGDSHRFEVEVIGIHAQAEPGDYPRLVASHGKAPPQYHWDDGAEDDEADEETK